VDVKIKTVLVHIPGWSSRINVINYKTDKIGENKSIREAEKINFIRNKF
jgi:hypothetical protein